MEKRKKLLNAYKEKVKEYNPLPENVRNLRKYRNLKAEFEQIKGELKDADAIIRNIERQTGLF